MIFFIKVLIIINLLYFKIIFFFNNVYSFIKCKKQYKNIENYLQFSFYLTKRQKYKKNYKKRMNEPTISIISPLFNSERYIIRFIGNIQYQNFNNIEIILIDDNSKDNSKKIIKNYQKEDERIILLKNLKNKGTFISRNLGVLFSKGKYIIIPDPDDILSKNILQICYKNAEKYKFEIIRFNRYIGNNRVVFNNNIIKKLIYQPELSTYIFYEKNDFEILDFWITNKFIKKETYMRALNSLKNNYLNLYMTYSEDIMMNYILYRICKSFCNIQNIGYYHIKNSISLSNTLFPRNILKKKFSLLLLKIIFDYSKNTKIEKDMSQNFYSIFESLKNQLSNIKKDLNFYKNSLNNFLSCKFISNENKRILESFKNLIYFSFCCNFTNSKY